MKLDSLKQIVRQAIDELHGSPRIRPSWVATRALQLSDPEERAPHIVAFAAHLEFRQIARETLRRLHEPENPANEPPRQHPLFPGLQAMYPKRRDTPVEDPEYVRLELLSDEDAHWNIARMRAGAEGLMQGADALEAWLQRRSAAA